jgi:F-type H+-transporting ATPase subunit b
MGDRWRVVCALIVLLALAGLAPGLAWATDGPEGGHDQTAAEKGHPEAAKEAEPPIFTPIRIDLAIWTLVVFLLLLFVLTKYAWGPMLEGLRKREETIRGALAEAQSANEEARRLREQFQAQMNEAQQKVRDIIDEGHRRAQAAAEQITKQAREEIQIERERLHREIALARDQALQELWNQTAQLATLVSAKAIRRQLSPEDHRRFVEEAIADLRQAGAERQREVAGIQS